MGIEITKRALVSFLWLRVVCRHRCLQVGGGSKNRRDAGKREHVMLQDGGSTLEDWCLRAGVKSVSMILFREKGSQQEEHPTSTHLLLQAFA
jgi:hypothetical protein